MNDEERKALEAQVRSQLEREHEERVQRHGARSQRKGGQHDGQERVRLTRELRQQFFEEKGYVRYTNSRGEEEWLLPEEAERRNKARKRRRPASRGMADVEGMSPRAWALLLGGGLLLGLFLGYFVLRG